MITPNTILLDWQIGWMQQDRLHEARRAELAALARQFTSQRRNRWRDRAIRDVVGFHTDNS